MCIYGHTAFREAQTPSAEAWAEIQSCRRVQRSGQGPQEVFGQSKAHPQARARCSDGFLYRCMQVHTLQALRAHDKR